MASAYRFDFVNRDGSVDTFEIGQSEDDGAAALKARSAMLVSLTAVAVEVWREDARVCRIRRDSEPPRIPAGLRTLALARGGWASDPKAFSRPADDDRQPSARAASA